MSFEGLALLLALLLGALAWALFRAWRLTRQMKLLDAQLQRAEVLGQEQATRLATLETLRDSQQLTEHAIATGTAVVKEMHKGIADIPFSVFEAIPATRASAKVLRGLHDSISDGVYGALGQLNKAVGRELRKGVPLDEQAPAADENAKLDPPATPEAAPAEEDPPSDPSKRSWG